MHRAAVERVKNLWPENRSGLQKHQSVFSDSDSMLDIHPSGVVKARIQRKPI
jgi:hypothetical protein